MKTNRLFDYWRRKEKEREEFKRREGEDSLSGNMTSSVALQTSINCSTRICPLNCETKELKRHLVYNLRQTWRDARREYSRRKQGDVLCEHGSSKSGMSRPRLLP